MLFDVKFPFSFIIDVSDGDGTLSDESSIDDHQEEKQASSTEKSASDETEKSNQPSSKRQGTLRLIPFLLF